MTKPAIIASTEFFNYPTESSETPENEGKIKAKTNFLNENKEKIGHSETTGGDGKYTTTYFDASKNILGESVSEWKGSFVFTKYFINEALVGVSKTFWAGEDHLTNYFNLEHEIVSRSHTNKQGSSSRTTYNIPITNEKLMLTRYTPVPDSFFISPLIDEAKQAERQITTTQTMFSKKSAAQQQEDPQNEPTTKQRGRCSIL